MAGGRRACLLGACLGAVVVAGCVSQPGGYGVASGYAAQGYAAPVVAPQGYAPAQGYAVQGYAAQPVAVQPAYGYPGGDPGYGGSVVEVPEAGYPVGEYVGPDGLTYEEGVPVEEYEGEPVPFLFVGEEGGWGYYDRGRQWHRAPPGLRERLERAHPGGRGLPPPGEIRQRFERHEFGGGGGFGGGRFEGGRPGFGGAPGQPGFGGAPGRPERGGGGGPPDQGQERVFRGGPDRVAPFGGPARGVQPGPGAQPPAAPGPVGFGRPGFGSGQGQPDAGEQARRRFEGGQPGAPGGQPRPGGPPQGGPPQGFARGQGFGQGGPGSGSGSGPGPGRPGGGGGPGTEGQRPGGQGRPPAPPQKGPCPPGQAHC